MSLVPASNASELSESGHRQSVIVTRGSKRIFFNWACEIQPLHETHEPDDECQGFYYFQLQTQLSNLTNVPLRIGSFYESPTGAWYSRIVRYGDFHAKYAVTLANKAREFWFVDCCTIKSAVFDLQRYLSISNKPIAVLLGQQLWGKTSGHCVTLIIQKSENSKTAYVKDCLPASDTCISSHAYYILQQLHFPTVKLCSQLEEEEHITFSDCIRESFKVVGDVLDGKFPAHFERIPSVLKTYNVTRKHRIF